MMLSVTDESDLLCLVHDKAHITKRGVRIPALERALNFLSEDGTYLWRGLYPEEVKQIHEVYYEGRQQLMLTGYTRFSEHRCIAEKFGGTKTMLHVHSIRGFPLTKWASQVHRMMKNVYPDEYCGCSGDSLIARCECNAEWILGMGTVLRIESIQTADGWTIVEAVRV